MKYIAIINNFNVLTWAKNMAEFMQRDDRVHVVIVDENSNYTPLLEWYDSCPYEVIRLKNNNGHLGGFVAAPTNNEMYIYTDPDLDLSSIPDDWLDLLLEGCTTHKAFKCGFSLEINDLPDDYLIKTTVVNWETKFWGKKYLNSPFFKADIDTTFSLINPNNDQAIQLRTDRPYTAKHMPWYMTENNMTPEYQNYLDTANSSASWAKKYKNKKSIVNNFEEHINETFDFIGDWQTSLSVKMQIFDNGTAMWDGKYSGEVEYLKNNIIKIVWITGSMDIIEKKNDILICQNGWVADPIIK
jgi:hypothetical protein